MEIWHPKMILLVHYNKEDNYCQKFATGQEVIDNDVCLFLLVI
jgi:hypothetical protein